jgi:hypothetical protein
LTFLDQCETKFRKNYKSYNTTGIFCLCTASTAATFRALKLDGHKYRIALKENGTGQCKNSNNMQLHEKQPLESSCHFKTANRTIGNILAVP